MGEIDKGAAYGFHLVDKLFCKRERSLHIEAEANGKTFLTVRDNHTPIEPGDVMKLPVNRWCVHVFDALSEKALCKNVYKELRPLPEKPAETAEETGELS